MTEKYTLRQWRDIRGFTQEQLARQVGVTSRTIANYEKDVEQFGNASYVTVQKIVDVLDIKLSDIFLGTDSEKPKQKA